MDRGYIDVERLYRFTLCSAFFVVRSKENILLQRRKDSDLDRGLHVCAGRNHPQAPAARSELLPNSTDFKSHAFRENAHFTGLGSDRLPKRIRRRP
jgi:hypothetical protein